MNANGLAQFEEDIIKGVMAVATAPDLLTFPNFGQRSMFWATSGEMRVFKSNAYAYPKPVSSQPPLPPVDLGPYPF